MNKSICVDCQFHRFMKDNDWNLESHFCMASTNLKSLNYVTGEDGFMKLNPFSVEIFTKNEFQECVDINTNGNCILFIPIND